MTPAVINNELVVINGTMIAIAKTSNLLARITATAAVSKTPALIIKQVCKNEPATSGSDTHTDT